jgi:hypothetical protein
MNYLQLKHGGFLTQRQELTETREIFVKRFLANYRKFKYPTHKGMGNPAVKTFENNY